MEIIAYQIIKFYWLNTSLPLCDIILLHMLHGIVSRPHENLQNYMLVIHVLQG